MISFHSKDVKFKMYLLVVGGQVIHLIDGNKATIDMTRNNR